MEAVCILLQVKPTWEEARKLLSDFNFIQTLENYDKDNIYDELFYKLQPYINDPEFTPASVQKKSVAAKSLCMWVSYLLQPKLRIAQVRAINNYALVFKVVKPKRDQLIQVEQQLDLSQSVLSNKQQQLRKLEADIAVLQNRYKESIKQKEHLAAKVDDTNLRIKRAQQILEGLQTESERWESMVTTLKADEENLIGTMIIVAGYITYLISAWTIAYGIDILVPLHWLTERNK
jgi:dynein heavy chain